MKKSFLSIAFFFTATLVADAQDRLTPEKLWDVNRISIEDVSPNGKQIIYSVRKYNVSANKGYVDLFLMETSSGSINRLTNTPEVSEGNAQFHPEGNRIGFLRKGAMYEIKPDGSNESRITPDSIEWVGFKYSPAGSHIAAVRSVKYSEHTASVYKDLPQAKARIYDDMMYRHWDEWEDGERQNVFIYSYLDGKLTNTGMNIAKEPFDSPMMPFGGIEQIAWSPKGKGLAYTSKKLSGKDYAVSTNSDIYLYDLATKNTYNVSSDNKGYDMDPVFSPTGSKIGWSSMQTDGYEADKNRFFTFSLAQWGQKEELSLGFDNDIEHPQWSKNGDFLYFIGGDKGTKQIFRMDVSTRKITQLTQGVFDYTSFVIADNCIMATRQSMSYPAELFKVNIENGEAGQVTFENKDALAGIKMGEVQKRMVKTTDGKEMLVWVILPPDFDKNKKYPALLYCQGGPQSALSQFWSTRWNFQLMAANGYVVVAPCRRGMPTFGREWNDQIAGDWGGQCMKDYLSAIDDVKKEPFINADKLGAVGASFGGYSVYWLAGNHEKRFKAFISHCGIFNLESWYASTEEVFFGNHDLGGAYWEGVRPPSYAKFSPHLNVDKWDTPLLVIHGEKDYRIPYTEGLQAFNAARLKGIPARLLTFPEEGHWVSTPQSSILWQREFFRWLDQYLK